MSMDNTLFFEAQPWTAIMPAAVDTAKLEKFSSAFYARLEKVDNILETESDSQHRSSLLAEKNMLQQVIEWQNMLLKSKG